MATEILRPNSIGDETNIASQYPSSGQHWDKVDEAVADTATRVYTLANSFQRDLYNLPPHGGGSGLVDKITLYFAVKVSRTDSRVKGAIKSDGIVAETPKEVPYGEDYITYSKEWATNPADGEAWEWADIDALQIGVSLKGATGSAYCTQVYVEVDTLSISCTIYPPKASGVGSGVIPEIIIEEPTIIYPPKASGVGSGVIPEIIIEEPTIIYPPKASGVGSATIPLIIIGVSVTIIPPSFIAEGTGSIPIIFAEGEDEIPKDTGDSPISGLRGLATSANRDLDVEFKFYPYTYPITYPTGMVRELADKNVRDLSDTE